MGKSIVSPVKRWPGIVVLQEPLGFPAYLAWKRALDAAEEHLGGDAEAKLTVGDAAFVPEISEHILPGICACVQEWHLEGLSALTPQTFPATPRKSSAALLIWLISEIAALITAEEEIPNA